jgi:hypothetical protein
VLVRWSDPSVLDATWEDAKTTQDRYPTLLAWGQASSQGGGDVSARPALTATAKGAAAAASHTTNDGLVARRVDSKPKWIVQPNRRFVGPEWGR